MTERETIYTGLSHGAWGYFFLSIDFNINGVSILPKFVGFLLLYSAASKLSGQRRDLALLRPLAALLAGEDLVDWVLSWMGGSLDGKIMFLDLVVMAAALYFHFQFLTDMAALAAQYQPEDGDLDRRLHRRRTTYTIILTAVWLISSLNQLIPWDGWSWMIVPLALVGFVAALMIMFNLFELRRCFREENGAEEQ